MHRNLPRASSTAITDPKWGICTETYFQHVLCQERKRSERTGHPFILMLLQMRGELLRCAAYDEIVEKCLQAAFSCKRDTDTCGWFRRGSSIAVIFTTSGKQGLPQALESIRQKVEKALEIGVSAAARSHLTVLFQSFPHDAKGRDEEFNLLFYPDMVAKDRSGKTSRVLKRALDIAGSLFGILLFSPFFLVIPVLIMATSRGPVLFRQKRYGQYGRKFTFYKFRSMYMDNDDKIHRDYVRDLIKGMNRQPGDDGQVYKIQDDPRITPIGGFLRRSSLDEIPQFFNVLKGDMSLVGPRPPIPYELEDYDLWHRQRLLGEKPGITGLWQVTGRSRTTFDEMVRLDLQYIRSRSFWLDLKLIFATPVAMFRGKGAY